MLTNHEEIIFFFQDLISFIDGWKCKYYVIFGDFNSVLDGVERWVVNGYGATSNELISLVGALGYLDMSLQGSQYTFFGSGNSIA